jgi:1-acyl-sn-glycerol-3-phosphate acyltransferase
VFEEGTISPNRPPWRSEKSKTGFTIISFPALLTVVPVAIILLIYLMSSRKNSFAGKYFVSKNVPEVTDNAF